MRGTLTVSKVLEIVDLYLDLDACRSHQQIADLTGMSVSVVHKIIGFYAPYDYSELIPADKRRKMAEAKRKRRRWKGSKIDLPTARRIRRIIAGGNYVTITDLAQRFGVERHTIYKTMRRLEC